MARPTRSVAIAMMAADGLVMQTKTTNAPRTVKAEAERKTDFLVKRLMLSSNSTDVVGYRSTAQKLGHCS